MSDLIGDIELYADKFGLTLNDLKVFNDKTKRAFKEKLR